MNQMNKTIKWNEDKWAKFVIAVDKSIDIMDSHYKTDEEVLIFKEIWDYTQRKVVRLSENTLDFWADKNYIIHIMQKATMSDIKRLDKDLEMYSFSPIVGWWR